VGLLLYDTFDLQLEIIESRIILLLFNKISPRGRRDDMPLPLADGSSIQKSRPSADGSTVRTSLVAGGD